VGLRLARLSFDYAQTFIGPVQNTDVPTEENGGFNSGSTAESPVNPKFGLQYQISENDMIYVTAAKGFRAGGVNSAVSYGICGTALDAIGYRPNDLPQTYKSDSVWSYEGGAKVRLLNNRLQLNGAVYRIDWTNPQYTTNPGSCGLITTFNVPRARSQGVEIEAQARVFRGLTLNGAFGYTDSKYLDGLVFPAGKATPENGFAPVPFTIVLKNQKIPIPPYTVSVGGRYDLSINSDMRAYLRADYRWTKGYSPNPFPVTSYTPDSANESVQTANFRVGVEYQAFDINLFVNNAFDRKTGVRGGGRSQCQAAAAGGTAACTTYAAYSPLLTINTGLPREMGLQITFRH
jgi:iron complex outermembrane recepter protein